MSAQTVKKSGYVVILAKYLRQICNIGGWSNTIEYIDSYNTQGEEEKEVSILWKSDD